MTRLQHWYQHQEIEGLNNLDILKGLVYHTITLPKWINHFFDEYKNVILYDIEDQTEAEVINLGVITF